MSYRFATDATARRLATAEIVPPAGFTWPFATHPIQVYRDADGQYRTTFDPRSVVSPATWAGAAFYADVATGNDAAAGTANAPVQSIWRAIELGNATAAPFRVFVKAGQYGFGFGINNNALTVYPTQDCAIMAWGGRVVVGTWSTTVAWPAPADAGFPNTWKAARSNVARVFDLLNLDAFGNYRELTQVATAALCNSTEDSWAQVGADLHVNRRDNAPVTLANTRPLLLAPACRLGTKSIYLSGIDLEGGLATGALDAQTAGAVTKNIALVDCTFKYAGSVAELGSGVRVADMIGLAAFVNCYAAANARDGFSGARITAGTAGTHMLTINCKAENNGRFTSTSNNGLTIHNAVRAIDIGGRYSRNAGGNVRNIDASEMWCIGTVSEYDTGDTQFAGAILSDAYRMGNTCKFWGDGVTARGCLITFAIDETAQILLRNPVEIGGRRVGAVGSY